MKYQYRYTLEERDMSDWILTDSETKKYEYEVDFDRSTDTLIVDVTYESLEEFHDHVVWIKKSLAFNYLSNNLESMDEEDLKLIFEMIEWFIEAPEQRKNVQKYDSNMCMYGWDKEKGRKGCAVGFLLGEELGNAVDRSYADGVAFADISDDLFNQFPGVVKRNNELMTELQAWHDDIHQVMGPDSIKTVFEEHCTAFESAQLELFITAKYE